MSTLLNFIRLILPTLVAVVVLASLSGPAVAQMPPDTQFLDDIRDRNYHETMAYLVNGGTPNARDYKGIPAIVAAARIGDAGMTKELIKYGANPNLTVKETGMSALMQSAARGNVLVIAVLLTNGANIDLQDNLGETALIKAVKEGKREIVMHMLNAGADIYLTDYTGYSAYDHAMRGRDNRIKNTMKKAAASR